MAHYALGATCLRGIGLDREELGLASLWAVAPDLDAIPAVVWTFLAPRLDVGPQTLATAGHLLGHRGFSHTFLAAAVVALAVLAVTRRAKPTLVAGTAWGAHVIFDAITEWPTRPLWPFSTDAWHVPLFTVLDPLVTVVSVGAVVGLLGPPVLERLGWPAPRVRDRLEDWGSRWGAPLAYATLGAVALSAGTVLATAATTDAAAVLPGPTPRTVALDADPDADVEAWNATSRWLPGTEGTTERIPHVADASNASSQPPVEAAECALQRLGPYAPVEHPTWEATREEGAWTLVGRDLIRRTADGGGPRVAVSVEDGRVRDAWLTGDEGPWSGFRVPLPMQLLEGPACR